MGLTFSGDFFSLGCVKVVISVGTCVAGIGCLGCLCGIAGFGLVIMLSEPGFFGLLTFVFQGVPKARFCLKPK